jgi:RHS repeat-associated protein
MSVPLATSPGRSGFGPQLSLSYDSGAGNGPFGFGWQLALPAITRATDRGVPQYRDADESDDYVLTGSDDLVPVLGADGTRFEDATSAPGFLIHRYRPRVDGLLARIERWTDAGTGRIHWRSITRDNVTTWYGRSDDSRISDPAAAPDGPDRTFSWLICETRDDKGNAVVYEYATEDAEGVDAGRASERNRVRTANRYLKRVLYGNRTSHLVDPDLAAAQWMSEVVLDYDEGHYEAVDPDPPPDRHRLVRVSASPSRPWGVRPDPFSVHRPGFEVRTYRRCHRVLVFHHIPDLPTGEPGYDGLVRSTTFDYADLDHPDLDDTDPVTVDDELAHQGSTRFASFLRAVRQSGHVRDGSTPPLARDGAVFGTYLERSLPPLEFEYSRPVIQDRLAEVESPESLPAGIGGAGNQLLDLYGDGVPGVLSAQDGAWFYRRNLGPGPVPGGEQARARLARPEPVGAVPNLPLTGGRPTVMDLAGDGLPDVVVLDGPAPGLAEQDDDGGWLPFRPFPSRLNRDVHDPNLRLVDVDGDGRADVLVTEDGVLTWHPSLGEDGFGPAHHVPWAADEEHGPRLVFADRAQSVYLADMSGDGLTDLLRIRNGEVCYWPNMGHGRFGAKVTMDDAPRFDDPDHFDQDRVRLADIDGSGPTDIVYLHRDGVRIYFNQSGNRLSEARTLASFPPVDDVASVLTADLLGTGTACLVWSSPLPDGARGRVRYVDLLGGAKPHLLVRSVNNLGAETEVQYAPSTRFALADARAGRPTVGTLRFPVQVVERVVTHERVSGNRFVTRYAYHHGHFDGVEREFRGFGMVEQWDTEEFAAVGGGPASTNGDEASHVPPVLTRTWFHTGVFAGSGHVSDFYAGLVDEHDAGEYYRPPGLTDAQARALLLDDTVLPGGLTAEEEREACRALKGSVLREEVYALDGSAAQEHPYTVTEQNLAVRLLQGRAGNRHAVFATHPRETVTYRYERDPGDPRVGHALTLAVDEYGNALESAMIAYGRRRPDPALTAAEQAVQAQIRMTCTENAMTGPVDTVDDHRTPLPCESRTYELTGPLLPAGAVRLTFDEVMAATRTAQPLRPEEQPSGAALQKRLVEHTRIYFRADDLTGPLPLGSLQSRALPHESCTLALTPGLVADVYGDRVTDAVLGTEAGYVHTEGDGNWWVPSGRTFYSPDPDATPAQELEHARRHFFLPHRIRDPFHTAETSTETVISYDPYDLLVQETHDALGNRVTAGERDPDPARPPRRRTQNYRVLQPAMVMDANRNRSEVVYDAFGAVAGTAVMGKPEPAAAEGDSLAGFRADLTRGEIDALLADPTGPATAALLGAATTRVVHDLTAPVVVPATGRRRPAVAVTLVRETADGHPGEPRIQVGLAYSDGFGREIQRKTRAEPGPGPLRDSGGAIVLGADGLPATSPGDTDPRWVGSGWTVFDNKGNVVRRYEPFFTDTHHAELDVRIGVSPVLFHDPVGRIVATLRPDHTWDKVVFDPWRQENWDVGDTALVADPRADADVGGFLRRLPDTDLLPTWTALRTDPAHAAAFAAGYPDAADRAQETRAAQKSSVHAGTPTVVHCDALGRAFLTVAHNRSAPDDNTPGDGTAAEKFHRTLAVLDIDGNEREVVDALGRVVVRRTYDLLGTRVHQASMEAGERRVLNDVAGWPRYAWDGMGRRFRITYDALGRPVDSFVREPGGTAELLVGRTGYGESRADAEQANLRGRVVEVRDQAGVLTTSSYDFRGNLRRSSRRLAAFVHVDGVRTPAHRHTVDWTGAVELEDEEFSHSTAYDALNRPVQMVARHGPEARTTVSVVQPAYNEAGLVERVDAWIDRDTEPAGLLDPATASLHAVTGVGYDAAGRRLHVAHGNGTRTTQAYDPLTFRLVRRRTRREGAAAEADLQDLHYTYDLTGNIAHVRDTAQPAVFFGNTLVEATREFTYDALDQLVEATGREHLGQTGAQPHSWDDGGRRTPHPADAAAMGRYVERYDYDAAGNLTSMRHRGSSPAQAGWTRTFTYEERGGLDPTIRNNRLTSTSVGGTTETYSVAGDGYDAHGNLLRMPHLPAMEWGYGNRLRMTGRQAVTGAQGERTWYVYDPSGQRVRKVTELASGQVTHERIYLGGIEVARVHGSGALVRETVHIAGDTHRVATVETRVEGSEPGAPRQVVRYQYDDHLGSVGLELDDEARIVSYEEYTPYGSTAVQAVRSMLEAPKRYRFAGKERDEESGLSYHGARYLAPWLGRWTSCDQLEKPNRYGYARNNPIRFVDPDGRDESPGMTRLWGGLRMVGGATQLALGGLALAAPEPTMLTKVVGVIAVVNGADDFMTGWRQMVSGRQERGAIETAVTAGAQSAGMSRKDAEALGTGTSMALGFVSPSGPMTSGPRAGRALVMVTNTGHRVATGERAVATATSGSRLVEHTRAAQLATHGVRAASMAATAAGGGGSSGSGSGSGSGGGSSSSPPEPPKIPDEYFDDALKAVDEGELKASGAHLNDLTNHAQSSAARAERGIASASGQSAHISARSAMRNLPDYDPRAALTRLLDTVTHRGFDDYWKQVFRQMANASGENTIEVGRYFDVMTDAIRNNPHFTAEEANSMVELLRDELFVQHGLSEDDLLRLPYSK